MPLTRREFLAASAAGLVAVADPPPAVPLGILIYSYGLRTRADQGRGLTDPLAFLEFCHQRGAVAVQVTLGQRSDAEAAKVRAAGERLGMAVEGIVRCPADEHDLDRFTAEMRTAAACGADVVRTVMLGGRRYEQFTKADDYAAFAARAERSLRLAEPIARGHRVRLAVENHKDFRTDELIDLLTKRSSEWIGTCVDTGNSFALLEDFTATASDLAKFAMTVHLKDIGVEEAPDGFRMAEVPLGQGVADLKGVVAALRKGNPKVRFHLEMITRDPLSIPCLTEKYWATLGRVPARDLARTLALVRSSARKEPLPRVTGLAADDQLAVEDRNVRESFNFAARTRLIPG